MFRVAALDHFVLRVRDLERSLAFYRDLLGLEVLFLDEFRAGKRPFVSVRIGEQLLDLVPDPTYDPAEASRTGGFLHFCVRLEPCDFEKLVPWLASRGVRVLEEKPVPRVGASGTGLSIYVTDPDGYVVELKSQ
ncbi:MAG: ring-cleaving dioxygenase [Candidatus Binatia bacterium]|nr:MAG: ring-cleaving dioxygenase [Candidatus Binatia bacterium]